MLAVKHAYMRVVTYCNMDLLTNKINYPIRSRVGMDEELHSGSSAAPKCVTACVCVCVCVCVSVCVCVCCASCCAGCVTILILIAHHIALFVGCGPPVTLVKSAT